MGTAVLALSLATPAGATTATSPGAYEALDAAISESTAEQDCAYVHAVTITLDGEGGIYTLDDQGALVPSAPEITTAECASEVPSDLITTNAFTIGSKDFTSGSTSFSKTDGNGKFAAQVARGTTNLAWSYRVSDALRAVATGNAAARVDRNPANCSYSKFGLPPTYLYHGTCPTHTYSTAYKLNGTVTFPINVAGVRGNAHIAWVFNYRIRSV